MSTPLVAFLGFLAGFAIFFFYPDQWWLSVVAFVVVAALAGVKRLRAGSDPAETPPSDGSATD
jgi:hypothetical protein